MRQPFDQEGRFILDPKDCQRLHSDPFAPEKWSDASGGSIWAKMKGEGKGKSPPFLGRMRHWPCLTARGGAANVGGL
jgi:hypothetical protein